METPMIHLNGTSTNGLADQYRAAYRAVDEALTVVAASAPHGRDYYVQTNPAAYTLAAGEHHARLTKLRSVADELLALYHAVEAQRR